MATSSEETDKRIKLHLVLAGQKTLTEEIIHSLPNPSGGSIERRAGAKAKCKAKSKGKTNSYSSRARSGNQPTDYMSTGNNGQMKLHLAREKKAKLLVADVKPQQAEKHTAGDSAPKRKAEEAKTFCQSCCSA